MATLLPGGHGRGPAANGTTACDDGPLAPGVGTEAAAPAVLNLRGAMPGSGAVELAVGDGGTATAALAPARRVPWSLVRRVLLAGYAAWFLALLVTEGVPTGRGILMVLAMTPLVISQLGRGWRQVAQVAIDWIPFTAALMLYDMSRALVAKVGMPLHEADIARFENSLFFGHIPTVWLQEHFLDPSQVHWWDALASVVYSTHFLATPALAAVLWFRRRELWLAFTVRVMALSLAGLATYVVFPEAPPWLAARDHVIEPVIRGSSRGWIWLHLGDVHELLQSAQREGSNPIAAMPSLHEAFAVLVTLTLWRMLSGRVRHLLWLYPLAMGLSLVYLGEHYVIDLVAGVTYAFVADWVGRRFEVWRNIRLGKSGTGVSSVTAGV